MRHYLLILLIGMCTIVQGQLKLIHEQKTDAQKVEVDNLGNYYLYSIQKIDKYSNQHQILETYSNNQLGEIEKIDVNNPFRNFVLHKDQNTLVVLDNTLTSKKNKALDLTLANLYNTTAFCYSSIDNGIWFYDKELFQLIKIDLKLNKIYESGNLLRLLQLDELEITNIYERKDKLYLCTEESVIIFDLYGAYYSTIHTEGLPVIGIEANVIYTLGKNTLKAYNTKTFETQELSTFFSETALATFKKNKIYVLENGQFSVFELK